MGMEGSDKVFNFKLLVVGDGGSGKTTFCKRHVNGEFRVTYIPTIGVEVHPLDFTTNKGIINFMCWDTAGQEKFGGLRDGYYVGGECAILMFDLSDRNSYKNIPVWYRDILRVCDMIPIVLVGNKYDIRTQGLLEDKILSIKRKLRLTFIDVSARTNRNYEKPFLYLMKKLLNTPFVMFLEEPALMPTNVEYTEEDLIRIKKIAEDASGIPLADVNMT